MVASRDARTVAGNILSWQSPLGGWPKNTDTTAGMHPADRRDIVECQHHHPTYGNKATTAELRFLARIVLVTHDNLYRDPFDRGYAYVLKGQYPTGGLPQFYPPDMLYHRYVTFNDDAMARLIYF